MELTLGHPEGLLALLGLPIVIGLHLFKRRPPRRLIATLFLVQPLGLLAEEGRRIDRLRSELPLWLRLLCVLLLSWLLVDPRFVAEGSQQRIAYVLDASASMSAFTVQARRAIDDSSARLARAASDNEWLLFDSLPAAPARYLGPRRSEMLTALDDWRPRSSEHDPNDALITALNRVKGQGLVVFVTDRRRALPPGVALLAVGTPIENVGFTSLALSNEAGQARVLAGVRNHGARPAHRAWSLLDSQVRGELQLEPGQMSSLSVELPAGVSQGTLLLDADPFELDDVLPFVLPAEKSLSVFVDASAGGVALIDRALGADPAVLPRATAEGADVIVSVGPPGSVPSATPTPRIHLWAAPPPSVPRQKSGAFAEADPLVEGLSFSGLLSQPGPALARADGDRVVVWRDQDPLIVLRDHTLLFGFDPNQSNAARVPACSLLLHRFLELARAEKVGLESLNLELGQRQHVAGMALTLSADGRVLPIGADRSFQVPGDPGFLRVLEGDSVRLQAASHFADVREADFLDASLVDEVEARGDGLIQAHALPDPLAALWAGLLVLLPLLIWALTAKKGVA